LRKISQKSGFFMSKYFDYLAQEYHELELIEQMIHKISDEIAQHGNRKRRLLDLEDLLYAYFSGIDHQHFILNPFEDIGRFRVYKETEKVFRMAIYNQVEQVEEDEILAKKLTQMIKEQI